VIFQKIDSFAQSVEAHGPAEPEHLRIACHGCANIERSGFETHVFRQI
jgi:hypothetical protein